MKSQLNPKYEIVTTIMFLAVLTDCKTELFH